MSMKFNYSYIKKLREDKNLSLRDLARDLHLKHDTIVAYESLSKWENGIMEPKINNELLLCSYFGVMPNDFVMEEKDNV